MTLVPNFKLLWSNKSPDPKLLVPLLTWCSGLEKNIETCQQINKLFFTVDKKILTHQLAFNNQLRHFIKYPKGEKEDEKTKFFYDDLAKYFDWTQTELNKNLSVINIEDMKEIIAKSFGYTQKERRIIKLSPIKVGKRKI